MIKPIIIEAFTFMETLLWAVATANQDAAEYEPYQNAKASLERLRKLASKWAPELAENEDEKT